MGFNVVLRTGRRAAVRIEVEPGVRLNIQDVGSGPPVVLLAGFGLDHRVWDRQVACLGGDRRVLCIDVRGHGGSDAPWHGYDLPQLALDVRVALDALGVDACTVVGWSFGGQIGWQLAAHDPARVRRLVLVGSHGVRASRSPDFPIGRPADQMLPGLLAAERADRLAARRMTISSGFARPADTAVLDFLVNCSLAMPSWSALACYETMLTADLLQTLPGFAVAVDQLVGTADPVHSLRGARWLRERLPAGRLVEIDGAGHFPMFEDPDAFDAALSGLLD